MCTQGRGTLSIPWIHKEDINRAGFADINGKRTFLLARQTISATDLCHVTISAHHLPSPGPLFVETPCHVGRHHHHSTAPLRSSCILERNSRSTMGTAQGHRRNSADHASSHDEYLSLGNQSRSRGRHYTKTASAVDVSRSEHMGAIFTGPLPYVIHKSR